MSPRPEALLRKQGYQWIAGVDEAGRGPLAGPVVAAACIIPQGVVFRGIKDSKALSEKERERLYHKIIQTPNLHYGIGIVDVLIIDQINILQATLRAMAGAIAALRQRPDYVLIDGPHYPSIDIPGEALIGGDTLSPSIMAGAILAKYTRDQIMYELDKEWPLYGFKEHKGYPTPRHFEALRLHGPCPLHRKSFGPVKNLDVGLFSKMD